MVSGDIVLCSWARHLTLTVPLSTQVYKWVLVNLMLGVGLQLGCGKKVKCNWNWDKLWPDDPLGSHADFNYNNYTILILSDLPLQRYFIIDAVPSDDTSKEKKQRWLLKIKITIKTVLLRLKWPTLKVHCRSVPG